MKKLIRIVALVLLFSVMPTLNEQVNETYWIAYASKKVEPAMIQDRRVATTFQLMYNDEQVTITNLHVCRIPNKREKLRRLLVNAARKINGLKPKVFRKLTDQDLIGQKLKIGQFYKEIIDIDEHHDLCVLEGITSLPSFSLATSYYRGELVRVIGYPRGLNKTIREGRIFDKDSGYMPWLGNFVPYLYISNLGYGGNSGSPVVNKWGNVVGVIFAGKRGIHTEMMAVPLEQLQDFLSRSL